MDDDDVATNDEQMELAKAKVFEDLLEAMNEPPGTSGHSRTRLLTALNDSLTVFH